MIAALPMYARPENRAAHDGFWADVRDGLRSRGIDAPEALDHDIDHFDSWGRPDLCLGQICNLPYRAHFKDRVTLIGASDYGLEGCEAGQYRSVVVVRKDDPATAVGDCDGYRLAYNDAGSQSGWAAAWVMSRAAGIGFARGPLTHGHRLSLAAVATGGADIAFIDAQTYRIALTHGTDATDQLKVIGYSHRSPAMSFITRKGQNPAPYFAAIQEAIAAMPEPSRATLGLCGIVALPLSAYAEPLPPRPEDLPNWS